MASFAGPRAQEVGHQEADLGGGKKLAGTLAGAFRKLAQQVFVGAAQEVGLHVGEAEAVAGVGKGLDDGGKLGRVDVALAVAFGGEVQQVDGRRTATGYSGRLRGPPWSGAHRRHAGGCFAPGRRVANRTPRGPLRMAQRASGGR